MYRKVIEIRAFKLLILYITLYSLVLLFELNVLYSERNYYNSFDGIYTVGEINKIIEADKSSEWINFIIVPFYILSISLFSALILNVFKFLFDLSIPFKKLFKITLLGHIVYFVFYFLNVIIRFASTLNILEGEKNYFSLNNYLDLDLPLLLVNLLKVLDLKIVIYMFTISFLIKKYGKISSEKSLSYVFVSIISSVIFYVLILSVLKIMIV